MSLTFTHEDLVRWATQSGDRNPIHFDDRAAQRIGQPGRIVHGMLAMMAMKRELAVEEGRWQLRFALKRALPLHDRYTQHRTEKGQGIRLQLLGEDEGQCHIQARCAPLAAAIDYPPVEHRHTVSPRALHDALSGFRERYPGVDSAWIFLDAFLFSEYIQHFSEATLHAQRAELPVEDDASALVMHLFHDLLIDEGLGALSLTALASMSVGYAVSLGDCVYQNGALHIEVHLICYLEEVPKMQVTMGLAAFFANDNKREPA